MKKKNVLIIISFIFFFGYSIKLTSQNITGKWYNYDFSENFIVFDTLRHFNIHVDDFLFEAPGLPYLIESNSNDSVLIVKIGSLFKANLYFFTSHIVFVGYKTGEISGHIDEVGLFLKDKSYKDSLNFARDPKLEILVPENFTGEAYIAFSQPVDDGLQTVTSEKTTIRIKKNGLLQSSIRQDPLIYARKNEVFRYESSNKVLPVFHPGFTRIEGFKHRLNPQDICVLSLGFNQSARSKINEKFCQEIEGDVGQYIIDTFENLVKIDKIN
ncbi:hypothetical protein [Haliscomenobacter sp.]|uniref:hypothetical protein n=1 Tax=Haliscomenobacter sp. TaxID=2717303 RepID=UPI003BA8D07F